MGTGTGCRKKNPGVAREEPYKEKIMIGCCIWDCHIDLQTLEEIPQAYKCQCSRDIDRHAVL